MSAAGLAFLGQDFELFYSIFLHNWVPFFLFRSRSSIVFGLVCLCGVILALMLVFGFKVERGVVVEFHALFLCISPECCWESSIENHQNVKCLITLLIRGIVILD